MAWRSHMFREVPTIRINNKYAQPEMTIDMFEHDMQKLDLLWQHGRDSARERESELQEFLCS